ncbi:MAG: hypothetical protein OEQ29_14875 [Alphaproteobacteria bacterium]|nr:hypothetical protein [Alphaproteobacteria bacterium]
MKALIWPGARPTSARAYSSHAQTLAGAAKAKDALVEDPIATAAKAAAKDALLTSPAADSATQDTAGRPARRTDCSASSDIARERAHDGADGRAHRTAQEAASGGAAGGINAPCIFAALGEITLVLRLVDVLAVDNWSVGVRAACKAASQDSRRGDGCRRFHGILPQAEREITLRFVSF